VIIEHVLAVFILDLTLNGIYVCVVNVHTIL